MSRGVSNLFNGHHHRQVEVSLEVVCNPNQE